MGYGSAADLYFIYCNLYLQVLITIIPINNMKRFHLSDSWQTLTARSELRIMESIIIIIYPPVHARDTCRGSTVWIMTPIRT